MNGNRVFVDTNIILYFLKGDAQIIELLEDKELVISFITEMELLSYPKLTKKSEEAIRDFLCLCQIVNIKQDIKELAIDFRRKSGLKLPDSIIAASAYYHHIPLLTADKEFEKIDDISVILYSL